MESSFPVTINGVTRRIAGEPANRTLLEYLRASGFTGAKEGCNEGGCGACSVALLGKDATGRPAWRAINSCLTLLITLADREIVTVEGVANGAALHGIQSQLVRYGGSQCGYCTPGIVMSLFEAYHRTDLDTNSQLDEQLAGNLCRCTGYRPIRDAAVAAIVEANVTGDAQSNPHGDRLDAPPDPLEPFDFIDPAGRRFFRPVTIGQTLRLLTQYRGARLISGSTEVGIEVTKLHADLHLAISLEAVTEITHITTTPTQFEIGAATPLTDVDEIVGAEIPMIREILSVFGSRQIRNRATLGGNLATASPVADLAPVLIALNAEVRLASNEGERAVPVHRFITGYRETCLREAEIIKSIVIPRRDKNSPPLVAQCYKVSKRREMDIATVTAAFALEFEGQKIAAAILAFGGVSPSTTRARQTEAFLEGREWNLETATETAERLTHVFTPISDHRGSAEYRRALTGSLFLKFFHQHPDPNKPSTTHSALTNFRNPTAPAAEHYPGES